MSAIEYLMDHDLLGYERVAVVRDLFDRQQVRFAITGDFSFEAEAAIGSEEANSRAGPHAFGLCI